LADKRNAMVEGVTDQPEVTDDQAGSRFVVTVEGREATLQYRQRGNRLVLRHTGVPPELEGRGIGGSLVRAAVGRVVRDKLTLVPLCPFARDWLERHPDAASGADIDWSTARPDGNGPGQQVTPGQGQ
jgi:uncharacterized protein